MQNDSNQCEVVKEVNEVRDYIRPHIQAHMDQVGQRTGEISPFVYVEALLTEATSIIVNALKMPIVHDADAETKMAAIAAVGASDVVKTKIVSMQAEAANNEIPLFSIVLGSLMATLEPLHALSHEYNEADEENEMPVSSRFAQPSSTANLADALREFLGND